MIRTVSIPIDVKPEVILPLMAQCADIFNLHVTWALTNQTYNKNKAHQGLYGELRKKYPDVPSGLLQTVRDTAMETVKASKFKRVPKKKLTSALRYDKRTFTLRGSQLTLSCLGPRVKIILPEMPEFFQARAEKGALNSLTLSYRKRQKRFFVNLSYELPDPKPVEAKGIQGLDRGLHHLVVTSDGVVLSNQKIRASQRKRLFQRQQLQAKGTRAAKRRLIALSGKEKRFSRDVNHCVTKSLIAQKDVTTFVLEDLSGIRNQQRGRKLNKHLGSWPFYQFETFLDYKAISVGKKVVFVDPRYTSQRCNLCGHIERKNRKGSVFLCVNCGHRDHADKNAAKNIRDRYILSSTETSEEQGAVNHPNIVSVSVAETLDKPRA